MRARLAVGAVVFRDDGAVLLVQRARPPLAGTWSLPGGKVRSGEALDAAIEREVAEETGIQVRAERIVALVTLQAEGYAYEIYEFLCAVLPAHGPADAPRQGDDAAAARWCTRPELDRLALAREVVDVVARARALASAR